MNRVTRWSSAAVLAIAATSVFAASAQAAPACVGQDGTHAVFVQTDALTGNRVVAYDRGRAGQLSLAGQYATGGDGGMLAGSVVDHTASEGSLTYDQRHHLLYAVNAGSNSVSVFVVHGDRLDLRQVVASGGSFPVSVTVHGDLVYVLNALDGGSIQGFVVHDGRLRTVPAWHRTLGLDPTATPQFTHTPARSRSPRTGRSWWSRRRQTPMPSMSSPSAATGNQPSLPRSRSRLVRCRSV